MGQGIEPTRARARSARWVSSAVKRPPSVTNRHESAAPIFRKKCREAWRGGLSCLTRLLRRTSSRRCPRRTAPSPACPVDRQVRRLAAAQADRASLSASGRQVGNARQAAHLDMGEPVDNPSAMRSQRALVFRWLTFGRPGEHVAVRPICETPQPRDRPGNTSNIEMLRRPLEPAQ